MRSFWFDWHQSWCHLGLLGMDWLPGGMRKHPSRCGRRIHLQKWRLCSVCLSFRQWEPQHGVNPPSNPIRSHPIPSDPWTINQRTNKGRNCKKWAWIMERPRSWRWWPLSGAGVGGGGWVRSIVSPSRLMGVTSRSAIQRPWHKTFRCRPPLLRFCCWFFSSVFPPPFFFFQKNIYAAAAAVVVVVLSWLFLFVVCRVCGLEWLQSALIPSS